MGNLIIDFVTLVSYSTLICNNSSHKNETSETGKELLISVTIGVLQLIFGSKLTVFTRKRYEQLVKS